MKENAVTDDMYVGDVCCQFYNVLHRHCAKLVYYSMAQLQKLITLHQRFLIDYLELLLVDKVSECNSSWWPECSRPWPEDCIAQFRFRISLPVNYLITKRVYADLLTINLHAPTHTRACLRVVIYSLYLFTQSTVKCSCTAMSPMPNWKSPCLSRMAT